MSNMRHRLGSSAKQAEWPVRVTRVEYVNRAGQLVNPKNGKPYDRPNQDGAKSNRGKKQQFPVKTKGVIFKGLDPIPTDPRVDPPPRVCYNCWQPGHGKNKCVRPIVAKVCNNCGRRGVEMNNCPRCQRAYVKFLASRRGSNRGGEILDGDFEEQLFPGEEDDYVNESSDDVLRNLIYQDERARAERQLEFERERQYEMRREQEHQMRIEVLDLKRSNEQLYENQVYETGRHEEPRYAERVVNSLYQDKPRNHSVEKEIFYRDERDNNQRSYYNNREHEEFRRRSESPVIDSGTKRSITTASSSSALNDPVHEVLELAKSISHLSPQTQELIMVQVMAERREHAKLRAMQQRSDDVDDDPWA